MFHTQQKTNSINISYWSRPIWPLSVIFKWFPLPEKPFLRRAQLKLFNHIYSSLASVMKLRELVDIFQFDSFAPLNWRECLVKKSQWRNVNFSSSSLWNLQHVYRSQRSFAPDWNIPGKHCLMKTISLFPVCHSWPANRPETEPPELQHGEFTNFLTEKM